MKKFLTLLISLVLFLNCCFLSSNAQVQPVTTDRGEKFASLAAAVDAVAAGTELILHGEIEEDINIDKSITLDLNGNSIIGSMTVTRDCILAVKDSQTDDYTVRDEAGYGKLMHISGNVIAASGYLKITQEDGISFHRINLALTTVTLRPEEAGIYYSGGIYGDEIVADNVDVFGIALRLDKSPDAAYMRTSSAFSRYNAFSAGADGNTASGTLLKNVMRKGRPTSENKSNPQRKIFGTPYIHTTDGLYYFFPSFC